MSVTVRIGGPLRSLLGGAQEVEAEGTTVGELVDELGIRAQVSDKDGNPLPYISIHVNGNEDIRRLDGYETPVKDGDTVTMLCAIGGGANSLENDAGI